MNQDPFDPQTAFVPGSEVTSRDGVRATLTGSVPLDTGVKVALDFVNGKRALVDPEALRLKRLGDGSYATDLPLAPLMSAMATADASAEGEPVVIPVLEEVAHIARRRYETGRVKLSKKIGEDAVLVDEPAWYDEVTIERVPVNKVVANDHMPQARYEGDVLILPVLEEALIIDKRTVLKEELRVVRARREGRKQQYVTLRREHVSIERMPSSNPAAGGTEPRGGTQQADRRAMMERVLVAVFDNYDDAREAKSDLQDMGFSEDAITLTGSGNSTDSQVQRSAGIADDNDESMGDRIRQFFGSMFGADDEDERYAGQYSEAVRRGSWIVTLPLEETDPRLQRATELMDDHGAIDIDQRAQQWSTTQAAGFDVDERRLADDVVQERPSNLQGTVGAEGDAIPVIEEEMKVGKREVNTGRVRVFTRVIQTPVQETVQLREERVRVERNPVDRPATEADLNAFEEGYIEVSETAEEPVVSKTSRVVEEVVVGKDVSRRDETVSDIVRRTDVEIERDAEAAPRHDQKLDIERSVPDQNASRTQRPKS